MRFETDEGARYPALETQQESIRKQYLTVRPHKKCGAGLSTGPALCTANRRDPFPPNGVSPHSRVHTSWC